MKRKKRNYWTKENCKKEALKYSSRSEFKFNAPSAYIRARKSKFLDEICSHMIKQGNFKKRCIYSYEFSDNYVYVGLTYNPQKRKLWRLNNLKDSVMEHIRLTGIEPEYKQLTEFIDVNEASILEGIILNNYIKNGWYSLNKRKTGNIGGPNLFWTKENCKKEALKYSSRNEFRKKSGSAYYSSLRNGWHDEICTHMKRPIRNIIWTKEKCYEEALKYNTKSDFRKYSPVAYSTSIKNKWINDICTHMYKFKTKPIFWTKEKCYEAANLCKTKTEFAKKYGAAYNLARKNNWINNMFNI